MLDFRTKKPVDPRTMIVLRLAADGSARVVPPEESVLVDGTQLKLPGYAPYGRILHVDRAYPMAASLLQAPELQDRHDP